jgi:hypothetical protein
MDKPKSSSTPFFVAFVLGALLCITVAMLATWADLESAFYGFDRRGSTPIRNLHCPILLNRHETGVVSVKLSNTADHKLSPAARAEFSSPLTPISTLESVELAPGESKTVSWTIGPENIDLERFIFSNIYIYAFYPLPDQESSCGTFVVDLPIPGSVLLWTMVLLGLAGMLGGLFVLNRSGPLSKRLEMALRPLGFLTIVTTLAMTVALAGWWVQAVLLLAVTLITVVVAVNYIYFRFGI